jgi:hypothetical protein
MLRLFSIYSSSAVRYVVQLGYVADPLHLQQKGQRRSWGRQGQRAKGIVGLQGVHAKPPQWAETKVKIGSPFLLKQSCSCY